MKKLGIITLLAIFLFNTAGYYVVFLAEQIQIRNQIRSEINSGNLDNTFTSVITVNKADLGMLEFFDGGNEMNYKGSLYDIAKKVETEKEITYYCINDSGEQSLLAKLDDHIKTHVANKPLKDNSKKSTDNVQKIYFSTTTDYTILVTETTERLVPVVTMCLPAEKQNSTPPPPEFC